MLVAMPVSAQTKQKKWKAPKRPKVKWKAPKVENTDPLLDIWRPYDVSDNWSIDIYGGTGGTDGENIKGHGIFSTMGLMLGAGVTKQTSYLFSTRLALEYAKQYGWIAEKSIQLPYMVHPGKYNFNMIELWLEEKFSLTNAFCRYNENRRLNVHLLLGVGVNYSMGANKETRIWELFNGIVLEDYSLDHAGRVNLALRTGLQAQVAISRTMDIFAQALFNMIGDKHNALTHAGGTLEPGIEIGAGLTFHLQDSYGDYRYRKVRRGLAMQLHGKSDAVDKYLAREKAQKMEKIKHINVEYGKVLNDYKIAFYIDRTFINEQEMEKIMAVSEFLKLHPEANLIIKAYSGASQNFEAPYLNLAKHRLEAVKYALTQRFGVDENRLVEWYDEEAVCPSEGRGEWIDAVEFEMTANDNN